MKNTLETRLGLFAAMIAVAAVLIMETLGSFESLKQGKRLHALFNTVLELKVGDRVKMAGVEIGRVEKIDLSDSKVKVTLKLRSDAKVKVDSMASIRFAGLLGQNFVSIGFGSPEEALADNDAFLTTAEQVDLSAMMQRLDKAAVGFENLSKAFSSDKIDNAIAPVIQFFKQNNSRFESTVSNLNFITANIAEGRGTFGRLVMEDSLYNTALTTMTNLEIAGQDLRLAVADTRSLVADARAGRGSIGKLLSDDSLYNDTAASMSNLRQILEKVNRGEGTAGKLVNDDSFYKNAKLTLQKVDRAADGIEDQGPLSVMGLLFSTFY